MRAASNTYTFSNSITWLMASIFVLGNIVFPQLAHILPHGGQIFLPIYFFTLIAAYRFGLQAGLLTALLSPVLNYLFFNMPTASMLPVILIKSGLLALTASYISSQFKELRLWNLALVVLGYQLGGSLAEAILVSPQASMQDILIGWPGMLLQVVGGYGILKLLDK